MYDGFYIQVTDKANPGDSFPIPEALFDPKKFVKSDEDPVHPITGEPLSAKPRTTVGQKAAAKKEKD